MKMRSYIQKIVFVSMALLLCAGGRVAAYEGAVVLCYHDVPKEVNLDDYGVDQRSFINTIEYLKSHGYTFISLGDLLAARAGTKDIPDNSVLLTFDDAYQSFYTFVYPMLKEYKIPSTVAVVTNWIEQDPLPEYVEHELMSWEQIREVADSEFVDVISHSHDLHQGIQVNPQKNKPAAAVNRKYDEATKTYETQEAYIKRITADLEKSQSILTQKLGRSVDTVAWPYGLYNEITARLGKEAGFEHQFTLQDKVVTADRFGQIHRFLIHKNPTIAQLRKDLNLVPEAIPQKRIVQVDLDMIYDEDPAQTEKNLGAFLDRIKDLKVTTVYLQAFSDTDATGNIGEVYFPNRVLPMKRDLFSRVLYQLKARAEVEVFAWMPMLALDLPEGLADEKLFVREYVEEGVTVVSPSWYKRLSPFSPRTKELLTQLYEDLAINAYIDGIVFQDDGYLNDEEDFQEDAVKAYNKISGKTEIVSPRTLPLKQAITWTDLKVKALNDLTVHLMDVVEKYRPEAKSARTLYAPVLLDPANQKKFGQSYQKSLEIFDYTVIMAYPYLEGVKKEKGWFAGLVELAKKNPKGIEKTVFKVQTYDWDRKRWIKTRKLNNWFSELVSNGARHIAYYPDDYYLNNPRSKIIRDMISVEDFPFKRDWK